MEEHKAKLKERMDKEIDEYLEKLEKSTDQEDFNINKMEGLMLENQGKLKQILNEANSELASNVGINVKKNVRSAETL
jgi:2C-methyl-D-erythritol 2,4-cyclodiphosphate synthase